MDVYKYPVFEEHIKPALEKVQRWQNEPEQDKWKFKGEFVENVWQHVESCLRRKRELFNKHPKIAGFIDGDKFETMILFHDAPEAFAMHGDVALVDPERDRKKAENDEEGVFRDVIVGQFGIPLEVLDFYIEYEKRSSVEAILTKLLDKMDAHAFWWINLTDEYMYSRITENKSMSSKLEEYMDFILDKLKNINEYSQELIEILLDFIYSFLMDLVPYLPADLQETQRTGIIKSKAKFLSEL